MIKVVLFRHGESVWNKENRFTGWTDIDLTEKGVEESKMAGKLLKEDGYKFDIAFTSFLIRGIRSLKILLKEMNLDIPIHYSWRLNERHYGALQGLNKAETAKKLGEKQVLLWRRGFDIRPPPLEKTDKRYPGNDPKYKDLDPKDIPVTESLKDTIARVLPYWHEKIVPEIKSGKLIIISAHGNSLRALVKYLDNIPEEEIVHLNIPTGIPLVYEFDDNANPLNNYYLGEPDEIEKRIKTVKDQGKAK